MTQIERKSNFSCILLATLLVLIAPHTAFSLAAPKWMLVSLYKKYERHFTHFGQRNRDPYAYNKVSF